MQKLVLLSDNEQKLRIAKVCNAFFDNDTSLKQGIVIADNANLFYLTGRVFAGLIFIGQTGTPMYFVRRPVDLSGDNVTYIRKPEDMSAIISAQFGTIERLGIELDHLPYSTVTRYAKIFPGANIDNVSTAITTARSIKTDDEIKRLTESGISHERVYRQIPCLYRAGMTDIEFQVEIERLSRQEGCLGQFRISGGSMELYMGNVLTGENADTPSPYDFAMGGAGMDPSLPVGANGDEIKPGSTVMIDMNGNFNGYMTDMTRVFSYGNITDTAQKAHNCSIRIMRTLEQMVMPGVKAKDMYEEAIRIVHEESLEEFFMGHRQHAGFIGHGLGIEINELPVIAPRSRDTLAVNHVIALEPKFVIPNIGAVGIENTYVVTAQGLHCLTNAPEQIINLGQTPLPS